ncbi:MAG TPA: hypothetical protein VM764_09175 [Gemmatimonadaceae bacterium]|nr:hypothetical protein [Gemmatimonadaceae bacterium]
MIAQQQQVLESFVRVQAFLEEHPVSGPLNYVSARETLDGVVPRLREFAAEQLTGRALSRAEARLQRQLVRQLVDRHMRPIVSVARAQIEPDSDVRLPRAIRMPNPHLGVTKILQASDSMIEAARAFEAVLVANGLPADFLARFTAARDRLESVLGNRATLVGRHVGAREALRVHLRRGRRAVARLDAVVRASFDGDTVTLARWRVAKRVQRLAGGASRGTTPESVEVQQAA